jgi:23S rRNA (adenine-N6)-dimethyltransferase
VIAIEAHRGRAQYLRQRFEGHRVTVVQTDAAAMRLPRQPFRVVANPPYAISSALLRVLLASGSRLVAADLVLQRAVVRQYAEGRAAGAGRWLRQWDVQAGKSLPRRAFRPVPRVDSAVLIVRRK